MYYILYISAATTWMDDSELEKILISSRKNNQVNDLTGVLLYANNIFIQLLEGEKMQVLETFEKISKDTRHLDLTIIASGDLQDRCFPEWQMGFRSVQTEHYSSLENFINSAKKSMDRDDCELPVKLLQSFVRKSKLEVRRKI